MSHVLQKPAERHSFNRKSKIEIRKLSRGEGSLVLGLEFRDPLVDLGDAHDFFDGRLSRRRGASRRGGGFPSRRAGALFEVAAGGF